MKKSFLIIAILVVAFLVRVVKLNTSPNGLNADEAAIGYNTWSLLKTGHDEHGASWPLSFRSFDDYKPPLYFYIVMPFVALNDLNIWSVRLPSALLGVATVYVIYLLTNLLFPPKKKDYLSIGTLAASTLAVMPWHIHFSRGGWEVNVATFFLTLSIYYLVKAFKDNKYFLPSALLVVASLYTYHSIRVIAPLLFLGLTAIYWHDFKKVFKKPKPLIVSTIIALILLIPLILQFTSGSAASRFSGVSVFSDSGPYWEAIELRNQHPVLRLPYRILHSQYVTYAQRFAKNYLSHFSPRFLFINGDEIARSKVPGFAQLFIFTAPLLLLGFLKLLGSLKEKSSQSILLWLLLAPLAASITFQSPHALRAQNMSIPLAILISLGIYQLLESLKRIELRHALVFLLLLFTTYNVGSYLHHFFVHYPKELPYAWQFGFEDLAQYLQANGDKYDRIVISDRYDQPYILTAFYLHYPPEKLQQELVFSDRDNFGFSTGRSFSNFEFHRIEWETDATPGSLLFVADEDTKGVPIHTIYYPNGEPVFRLFEIQ